MREFISLKTHTPVLSGWYCNSKNCPSVPRMGLGKLSKPASANQSVTVSMPLIFQQRKVDYRSVSCHRTCTACRPMLPSYARHERSYLFLLVLMKQDIFSTSAKPRGTHRSLSASHLTTRPSIRSQKRTNYPRTHRRSALQTVRHTKKTHRSRLSHHAERSQHVQPSSLLL